MSWDLLTIPSLLSDYTLRNVTLGSALLGLTGGVVGTLNLLKKQSLLGDAVAHCSLPGICLSFLILGHKVPFWLLVGGGLTGWLGALCVRLLVEHTRVKEDAALGCVLSAFFGLGLTLLTLIAKINNANQAGLESFLFGQAATIIHEDVVVIFSLCLACLMTVGLLFKEFKIYCFDPDYSQTLGFSYPLLDKIRIALVVTSVVIGLQTVGVILMSALLVIPAAAARQWSNRLSRVLLLGGLFGALSGILGTLISSSTRQLPTGPVIVIVASLILLFSLLFAPQRGVIASWYRDRNKKLSFKKIQETSFNKLDTKSSKETETIS